MRLSTPCLSISKNGCIVSDKAAEYQVSGTHIKDLLLGGVGRKHSVELELLLPNEQLFVSIIHVDAGPLASLTRFLELYPDKGSHSHSDSHGAGILNNMSLDTWVITWFDNSLKKPSGFVSGMSSIIISR